MHKALFPLFALVTIIPLLLAPPTSRADAAPVAPPADDETLIYVIREGRMLGAAVGPARWRSEQQRNNCDEVDALREKWLERSKEVQKAWLLTDDGL